MDMGRALPKTCKTEFDDPNKLHQFILIVSPDDGDWHGGKYRFLIDVPEEYNMVVSIYYQPYPSQNTNLDKCELTNQKDPYTRCTVVSLRRKIMKLSKI
jgi:hypothetical protein